MGDHDFDFWRVSHILRPHFKHFERKGVDLSTFVLTQNETTEIIVKVKKNQFNLD